MENDPTTPKLEASTMSIVKDLEEATTSFDGESFVNVEESISDAASVASGKSSTDFEKIDKSNDPMSQSKYAQVNMIYIHQIKNYRFATISSLIIQR